ncbi:hypothetical protein RYX36_031382, partial [Vicia faba]
MRQPPNLQIKSNIQKSETKSPLKLKQLHRRLVVAHFSDYYVNMDSKFKDGSFEYINMDAKNVGATMRVHHRSTKGESKDCCCINIYVNNNVQGVTNSVLHDSEVRMRDPGVRLYF